MAESQHKGKHPAKGNHKPHKDAHPNPFDQDDDERGQLLEDAGQTSGQAAGAAEGLVEGEVKNAERIEKRHRAQRIKGAFAELSTMVHLPIENDEHAEENAEKIREGIKKLAETIGVKVK